VSLTPDDLVAATGDGEGGGSAELYTQETELPVAAKLAFIDGDADYRQAAVEARRLVTRSGRVAQAQLPIALSPGAARSTVERWLHEAWMARESAAFALPPTYLALEPTDVVTLTVDDRAFKLRLTRASEGLAKAIEAKTVDAGVLEP
jgi:hypothetical protein